MIRSSPHVLAIGTGQSALDERSIRAERQVGPRAWTGTPVRIAKSSGIAASIPGVNALEPISPELVLVDPDLARVARARLPERETAAPDHATTGRPVRPLRQGPEPAAQVPQAPRVESPFLEQRPRRRVAPVLLTISLMANAILIAVAVAGARDNDGTLTLAGAFRTTTIRAGPSGPSGRSSMTEREASAKKRAVAPRPVRSNQPKSSSKVLRETSGEVERKILNLVIQSPSGKLPPALIDAKTGLAKNGLQAVCTLSGAPRSFLCLVRPAQHKAAEGLYVRYRAGRGGAGVFTWYRYRDG